MNANQHTFYETLCTQLLMYEHVGIVISILCKPADFYTFLYIMIILKYIVHCIHL